MEQGVYIADEAFGIIAEPLQINDGEKLRIQQSRGLRHGEATKLEPDREARVAQQDLLGYQVGYSHEVSYADEPYQWWYVASVDERLGTALRRSRSERDGPR